MSGSQRPPLSHQSSSETFSDRGDPFSDRQPRIQFQDPPVPQRGAMPTPYQSSTSLPHEFGGRPGYNLQDDEEEKVPLTGDPGFVGGLYPPG